jgi:hypothetical protein
MESHSHLHASSIKVDLSKILIGKPIPWSIFDESGTMLLKKGYIIINKKQLQVIEKVATYRSRCGDIDEHSALNINDDEAINPFVELSAISVRIARCYSSIIDKKLDITEELDSITGDIYQLASEFPDACIGYISLHTITPSAQDQALYYALLCTITANNIKMKDYRIKHLITADIMANIALSPYMDRLNSMTGELTEKLKSLVKLHPKSSKDILDKSGYFNNEVTNIILKHHSVFDESLNDGLGVQTQLLAISEQYVSLTSERKYRETKTAYEALGNIYKNFKNSVCAKASVTFVKSLSLYPPGSFVRLENNSLAVVVKQTDIGKTHNLKLITDSNGKEYNPLKACKSSEPGLSIKEATVPNLTGKINLHEIWHYA